MNSRYAALLGDCTMLMNSRGKFPFKHNFSESIHSFSLNKRKICTLLQISTNKTSNVNPKKSSECLTIHSNINCFPQKRNGLNSEKWKKLNSWASFWIYQSISTVNLDQLPIIIRSCVSTGARGAWRPRNIRTSRLAPADFEVLKKY